ncbi:MAG: hypothetical protein ACJ75B_16140 [Flavisolibacter sp.]
MKKSMALVFAFTLVCFSSFSQSSNSRHVEGQTSFYAELGGPGILFSANIDHRFAPSRLGWGGRLGLGFVTGDVEYDPYGNIYNQSSVVTIPFQVNYIFGKENNPHTFEVGAGATFAGKKLDIFNNYNSTGTNFFVSASFMYRRQPVNGGFSWRIGFTPLIAQGYIQPSGAVSVGYNF